MTYTVIFLFSGVKYYHTIITNWRGLEFVFVQLFTNKVETKMKNFRYFKLFMRRKYQLPNPNQLFIKLCDLIGEAYEQV